MTDMNAQGAGGVPGAGGAPSAGGAPGAGGAPSAGGAPGAGGAPSEAEMQAAYEAELNRITSTEMVLQTAVSLLNIGGRRLGLGGPAAAPGEPPQRDLEQVRDAIDAVRGLMPVLERRMAGEIGPLRDAISQLQMAYMRELNASTGESAGSTEQPEAPGERPEAPGERPAAPGERPEAPGEQPAAGGQPAGGQDSNDGTTAPGPAQSSGRLWVPGR